ITVNDGSGINDAAHGFGVFKLGADCNATPTLVAVIPNTTVISARGHYLLTGATYGLGTTAASNLALTSDIENDRNVAIFSTADINNLSTTARLDAVGFGTNTGSVCDLLSEGPTLAPASGSISEHSFVRKLASGTPQDTNDNASDFQLVSTTPATPVGSNTTPTLGAPGPENSTAPIQRNATIKSSLVDPGCASTSTDPTTACARIRTGSGNSGTLLIRRRFTNTT